MEDLYNQIELCRNLKEINKVMDEIKDLTKHLEFVKLTSTMDLDDVMSLVHKQQQVIELFAIRFNLEVGSND